MLQKIQKKIQEFLKDKGQGIVEYALILGFVAIIAVTLFQTGGVKEQVSGEFSAVASEMGQMSSVVNSQISNIK